jgi:hydrogenase maturation protease
MGKTLVLGIGNTLLSDEGVGIHVIDALRDLVPNLATDVHNIELMDGGTLSFTLADPIQSCQQLIVIDASELGQTPGSIEVYENESMDHFVTTGNKKSVHEVSLVDVLSIALLSGKLPARRALIGIQPQSIDWGDQPTKSVRDAIPLACQQVASLITRWQA